MRTVVEQCGVVVLFGKYTDIASLVLLFGFTHIPVRTGIPIHACTIATPMALPVCRYRYRYGHIAIPGIERVMTTPVHACQSPS